MIKPLNKSPTLAKDVNITGGLFLMQAFCW